MLALREGLVRRPRQPVCVSQDAGHRARREIPERDDAVDAPFEVRETILGFLAQPLEFDKPGFRNDDLVIVEQTPELAVLRFTDRGQLLAIELVETDDKYVFTGWIHTVRVANSHLFVNSYNYLNIASRPAEPVDFEIDAGIWSVDSRATQFRGQFTYFSFGLGFAGRKSRPVIISSLLMKTSSPAGLPVRLWRLIDSS